MLNSDPYNPDVLTCLANLSSDEVFTPPKLANEILDQLPVELWSNPEAKFLDPFSKSGVFLREIAKRLLAGLEEAIPDQQERANHIFKNQVYGIAITEMTALLCRRSVYCSKIANGPYSVCDQFDDAAGNIRFELVEHTWENGKCTYCGACQDELGRGEEYEGHAYEFIHTQNPEEIFNMKFDVIIGNPPYQLSDAGDSTGSTPIYHKFVKQAQKMQPRYLSMVIPSRWFAGGKGLDHFRDDMLNDRHITRLVDHPIASDVFPGVKVIGGICYFLWERDRKSACKVTTRMSQKEDTILRELNSYDIFVRFNKAISILEKIHAKGLPSLSHQVSRQKPFGLRTFARPSGSGTINLYANKTVGKIKKSEIPNGHEMLDKWKVLTSRGYGEGGETREYPRMILGKPIVTAPKSACTETYIVVGNYDTKTEADNLSAYLKSKFVRFLICLRKNTQDVNRDRFVFVPAMDMKKNWTDENLNQFYGITNDEIEFINTLIRPME